MNRTILLIASFFMYAGVQAQITTAADGNWTNPATWVGGVVPTAADEVVISASHDVVLNASGAARSLTIQTGGTTATNGTLTLNVAGATLTIGDFDTGGGKDSVVVRGGLTITNGALNIGGRLRQYASPASYVQSGGIVRIDGNTGTAGSSVADADYLLKSDRNYVSGFSFSGGTLLFVDPPLGASGNLMVWNVATMYLGANSHIQFGDGVSTTSGGNPQGFILNSSGAYVCGNVTINNPSGTNRMVTNPGCVQMSDLNLVAGTINNSVSLNILGAAVNSGIITQSASSLDFRGGLDNSGSITVNNNFYTLGNVTNNAAASITAPNLYVTYDLVNNGTITANTTLGFARTSTTNSTAAQVISGSGTFNVSTATLKLDNSNAAGVTLERSLVVSRINLSEGKLYLGSNDITFSTLPVTGGSALAYIVTNGTGRLRFTNLTTTEVLFPIGTASSYNPVRINNGSGHTFSAGVKAGFTVTPPGTEHVLREWDIDDVTGGTVSATLTLQWNAADEDPTFNRTSCTIAHYGTSWMKVGTTGSASGTNPYTKTATNVTSFSPFTVSSNSTVLPVKLFQFEGKKENGGITLSWRTTEEVNISHFEVEKSTTGSGYVSIARLNAFNITGVHTYESKDAAAAHGTNYYRLKMVDRNGSFSYSAVIKFDFMKRGTMIVSPNPAKGFIVVQSSKDFKVLRIADMTGRVMQTFLPTANSRYDVSRLPKGLYVLQLVSDEGLEMQNLIIQ